MQLRHVGIIVTDIQEAHFFYSHLLGMMLISSELEKGNYIETLTGLQELWCIKYMTEEGDIIECYLRPDKPCYTLGHMSFTVFFLQSLLDKLNHYGYITTPIMVNATKTCKVAFCQDKDGNRIELVEEL